ncbi:haloacid dehalogenase [Actinoplanes italicus]|uniref:Putative hydrolase of the HAD superfamily n=1 Tax=Actinoplanes italicus TaxID=113567 RepID=A0A2T0K327_9ACTN|nr:HAD family hydrolase [Actinoplanes italicus]PRX17003.1 putative hydrolase of the HAD superfamily [Actinoplanes italicus]GIE36438.1 haloacid dehalogenase [Actinoplanes italicus]
MLNAVLFDLDDTLVDQVTASGAAVVAWAAELGVTGPDVATRWAAASERHYARYQTREITFGGQRRERVRDFLGATLTDGEADELFAGYLRRYEDGWTVFDDAVPALRRARAAGLTVAVLTNGDETQQRRKLDRLGLAPEIDVLIASSALPAGKPDPRAFAAAVGLLGLEAERALMVGDSPDKDVRGAVAAGLPAVLLDRAGVHPDPGVPVVRDLHGLDFPLLRRR